MAANYNKRDERGEQIRKALEEQAPVRDAPTIFQCSVCGVEMSATVPIMAVTEALRSAFYCQEHVPEEWR